ncbi:hypothetical protein Scep_027177 [Stephania cephalantha]|uniref:Uncharacterized protein n=1 Tax=Stephania cephalantha TaxID=152367 RepID=A0AAP0ETQ8_9MAGN
MLGLIMRLLVELMATLYILFAQPFSLAKLLCSFGARSVCFCARALANFLNSILYFLFDAWWITIIWTVAFFSLPYRILTAIRREHMLEMHLHEMQIEMEYIAWDKKELQERLRAATKNCKIIESMLTDLEDDHDQALDKIELLQKELQDVKDENRRLYETRQSKKDLYGSKARDHPSEQDAHGSPRPTDQYDAPLVKSGHNGSGVKIQHLLMHGDGCKDGNKGTPQIHRLLTIGPKGSRPVYSVPGENIPRPVSVDEILDQCKRVALSRSLFSAILSLIVGVIIWGAEDPCTPLVLGLFAVVGLSLRSVLQFFSTMNNTPATNAAALLSFNWFILGTLAYPTLPRLTRLLAPLLLPVANQTASLLGVSLFGTR